MKIHEYITSLGIDKLAVIYKLAKFFLFSKDELDKQISSLSGGEKSRLQLMKIYIEKPNLILLDEPVNHLDIEGKQTVKDFLQKYKGNLLIISHDRWIIDEITNTVYAIEEKKVREEEIP